jgi:hypothetical protein
MSSNVLLVRKFGPSASEIQPETMPVVPAPLRNLVLVMKAEEGAAFVVMRTDASLSRGPHPRPTVELSAPAYSITAKSMRFPVGGVSRKLSPVQSPFAGVGFAEVKTMGSTAVPTATS